MARRLGKIKSCKNKYASMVAIMTGGTVTNGGSKNILLLSTAAYFIKQLLLTMIFHDLASIWQDVLARLSHARILPSFMARRLGKIKSCKNLAKFHGKTSWQD